MRERKTHDRSTCSQLLSEWLYLIGLKREAGEWMSPLFFSIDCNFEIQESAFRGGRRRRYQLRPWRNLSVRQLFSKVFFWMVKYCFCFISMRHSVASGHADHDTISTENTIFLRQDRKKEAPGGPGLNICFCLLFQSCEYRCVALFMTWTTCLLQHVPSAEQEINWLKLCIYGSTDVHGAKNMLFRSHPLSLYSWASSQWHR